MNSIGRLADWNIILSRGKRSLARYVAFAAGQVFAYSRGMRPALDYSTSLRPRLTRRHVGGTIVRTIGYTAAALFCGFLVHHIDYAFAILVGLVTGLVTGAGLAWNPFIEYYADNLPERRLAVVGIALMLCGFALSRFSTGWRCLIFG